MHTIHERFNCACGKNQWFVTEIYEKNKKVRHMLSAKCCFTDVHITVQMIEYSV